ncbi:hypothetical protein AOLI_G00222440 [Acnodon oligacanthus]
MRTCSFRICNFTLSVVRALSHCFPSAVALHQRRNKGSGSRCQRLEINVVGTRCAAKRLNVALHLCQTELDPTTPHLQRPLRRCRVSTDVGGVDLNGSELEGSRQVVVDTLILRLQTSEHTLQDRQNKATLSRLCFARQLFFNQTSEATGSHDPTGLRAQKAQRERRMMALSAL